jgi:lipopolysaccharide transport system ATP-binding protein
MRDFINTPVQYYSSGMKVRLGFAVAAQLSPDILLIDEVLAVGDLWFKIKCLNRIGKLMRDSAVIFVSHSMQYISLICTEVMVLDKGRSEYRADDVAGGIDYYFRKTKRPNQGIIGSGKATISNVQLLGLHAQGNSEEPFLLNYGDELLVQLELLLDASVKRPALRIILFNRELRPVADCDSHFCGFEIIPKRFSRIKLKLKNVQLNMGTYSISIVVIDLSNNEVLSRNNYAAHFQVKTTYPSWASFLLLGEWEQEQF